MMRVLLTSLSLAIAGTLAAQQAPSAAVDLQGKFYRSAFSSGVGTLARADLALLPEPLRGRLARFLERRAAFKSRYRSAPDTLEQVRADAKRRVLERSIVSLVEAAGVEDEAARFVAAAPIAHEWQGMHDGPVTEAAYAEDVLEKNPGSPLAPWLCVFIAERQRVAFETYVNEKNDEGMKVSAQKYRAFAERARTSADPAYGALLDDIDRQPYLYIKGTKHPREYVPGA
jgi:hypothetical protein